MTIKNAETLPALWYHDPDIYALEREAIFKQEWQLFTHEELLQEPGSYVADTIAGWSIFVLRGKDGKLKAHHNVCRHRAGPLFEEGSGKAAVIRCQYHGWIYDEDGKLKKAPDYGEGEEALCKNLKLYPVQVDSWRGLVFINLAENPMSLETALGDLPGEAAKLDLESFRFLKQTRHRIRCNWKTYVENYMEGYHIPAVHPALNREVDMQTYRVRVGDRVAFHETDKKEDGPNSGLWPWIYPNAAINVYQTGLNVEMMVPLGPEETELRYLYLLHEDEEDTIKMSQTVTQEDIDICEAVQRNLRSGTYDTGRLSVRHENGVEYFQSLVRDALNPYLTELRKAA